MLKKAFQTIRAFRFKRFALTPYGAFNSMHRVVTIGVLSGFALMSAHASAIKDNKQAESFSTSDTVSVRELDEVSIMEDIPTIPMGMATTISIDSSQISQAPAKSIQDLLTHISSVDVMQRSPHGVQADVSLRGSSFDQVAILINGISLTNPQTGHHSLNLPINKSDLQEIEVIQGTTSLLHNSGAFAGGVNIVTKSQLKKSLFAQLQGGMYELASAEFRGVLSNEKNLSSSLSVGYSRSNGYVKNSDYKILNTLFQTNFRQKDLAEIKFLLGYNQKHFGANTFYSPAYPLQYEKTKTLFSAISAETYGKLQFAPRIYWSRHYDEFQLFRDGSPNIPDWYKDHNYHRSDIFGLSLSSRYLSLFGITSIEAEMRNEGVLSSVLGEVIADTIGKFTRSKSRTSLSYALQHRYVSSYFTVSVGVMLNTNTAYQNMVKLYPAVSLEYRPEKHSKIYASWNMANRMPTFTELYYSTKTHTGNPLLLPEQTHLVEAGYSLNNRYLNTSISAFYTHAFNVIDWEYSASDDKWYSGNLPAGKPLKTFGLNLNATLDFKQLINSRQPLQSLSVGYQYIYRNTDGFSEKNPISMYVFNYLRNKFTASLKHEIIRNLTLSWYIRLHDRVGSYLRYEDGVSTNSTEQYKPFAVLDFKCQYKIKGFNIFLDINNLTNTPHIDYGNIPQPGFWLSGGVSYSL